MFHSRWLTVVNRFSVTHDSLARLHNLTNPCHLPFREFCVVLCFRPKVPLPPALVEQMKNKFMSLATKPIKKVAEARARKRKRAAQRLVNAKKKATALAANPGEKGCLYSNYRLKLCVLYVGGCCPVSWYTARLSVVLYRDTRSPTRYMLGRHRGKSVEPRCPVQVTSPLWYLGEVGEWVAGSNCLQVDSCVVVCHGRHTSLSCSLSRILS